jgi:hypothetical protein
MNKLEVIWNSLLSRDPEEIRKKFSELDPESKKVVLGHLQNMVTETGWHPEQVASARIALEALAQHKGQHQDY